MTQAIEETFEQTFRSYISSEQIISGMFLYRAIALCLRLRSSTDLSSNLFENQFSLTVNALQ